MATPASDIDLSPMILHEFVSEGKRYRTEQPLVFKVNYIEEDEVYLLEGEYHTILWGATREEAWDVLIDDFDWKWRHIAGADPEELAPFYADMRVGLRQRFSLVSHAP